MRNHLPAADKVIVKFVNYIGDKCEFLDFLPELERLNLECKFFYVILFKKFILIKFIMVFAVNNI